MSGALGARAEGRSAPREAAQRPTLGIHAISPSSAAQRRNEAWALRRRLWEVSSLQRVRDCGRVTHITGAGPALRVSSSDDGRVAGLAGLVSCGSVWSCPVCARKIGARRADEIRQVVSGAFASGGGAALITLTLRHHAKQSLKGSWAALRYAWGRVNSGRAYQDEMERFGITGWCAVVEVTHGESGWHPHMHVLVLFDTATSAAMVENLADRWFIRWQRALARKGYSAVADKGGLDVRVVSSDDSAGTLGHYLSKVAHEVTSAHTKNGRKGNRTPFEILKDALATGSADDFDLWWEYERASHGRKQLTWSKGTKQRFGVEEKSDEEVAGEDAGDEDLIALPLDTWRAVRHCAEELLTAAEVGGLVVAIEWLNQRGLRWLRVTGKGIDEAL